MKVSFPFRRVYGVPMLLAALTLVGLLFALFEDGLWDAVSWGFLALPLLLLLWYLFLHQPWSFAASRRR